MLNLKFQLIISFIGGCLFTNSLHNAIFFLNTKPYTVPSQEVEKDFTQPNVIFMYQKNRTDESFYKMLSYADDIIFIGDQKWKCVTTPCLELQSEYNYQTLDLKLVDTLTQLVNKFPHAKTFAKLDDDAIIHPKLYYELVEKFEPNHYAGKLREYTIDGLKMKFLFMEGQFYMISKEMAECFLKNSLVSKENIGEDIFLGKIISTYCNPK